MIQGNYVKRKYRIIKIWRSYDNIISTVTNLLSITNTTEDYTDSFLQTIIPLSSETLKDDFFHLGGKIRDLPDQKKQTAAVKIIRRWGKDIIKEGAKVIS